jgi:hypothetical protein
MNVLREGELTDLWEYDFKSYTFHYIWCLYAIVWGIRTYDLSKKTLEEGKKNA